MSENIFTELYSRVLSLFGKTEQKEENVKEVACNRLRVVLMQDRTNITPELLQRMRKELVDLLSKYVEMDKEALELNFEQEGEQMALMLSIPVIRAKDETEIEKAIASENDEDAEDKETDDSDNKEAKDDENDSDEDEIDSKEESIISEDENLAEDEASEEEESEIEISEEDENAREDEAIEETPLVEEKKKK